MLGLAPRLRDDVARLLACALLAACGEQSRPLFTVAPPDDGGIADAAAVAAPLDPWRPRVGVLTGEVEGRLASGAVRSFLGIPYAQPPVGELRFQPPQPHEGWSSTHDASQFGKRCPQLPPGPDEDTEDCLHLNVWTPAASPDERLPVMVWIHGGGHIVGSTADPTAGPGSESLYSGEHLAGHGVVVVTLNYRLGVLGFFAHEALAREGVPSGNQGLWDQQMALSWVRDNIAAFGGDPDNVTLFGESAGSVDVCLHMASPQSRGLFHRAISQSGACTTKRRTLRDGEQQGRGLATQLGCASDGKDPLACLRTKSVSALLQATTRGAGAEAPFGPIVDGEFLPAQPRALFDRGELAPVPYMLGTTDDEGSGFVLDAIDVNDSTYLAELSARFAPPVDEIAQLYPPSAFADSPNPAFAALARAVGDARFVCPTQDTAERALAHGLRVYLYNFDVPFDGPDGLLGAVHASELGYVFGTWPAFTPETRAVSERMRAYWSHFARSGNPNGDDLLPWPRLAPGADARLNFGLESSVVTDFRASECTFWRQRFDAAFEPEP